MSEVASRITSFPIVYSTVYSGADQRKHQSSESLAFVRGIHRWPVNSPRKVPVTWKMFPFDDVIMTKLIQANQRRPSLIYVAWSTHSHYPNQCWIIVNWAHVLQWYLDQNSIIFIEENVILPLPQYVKQSNVDKIPSITSQVDHQK